MKEFEDMTVGMLIDILQKIDKTKLVKIPERWDGNPSSFICITEEEKEVYIYGV